MSKYLALKLLMTIIISACICNTVNAQDTLPKKHYTRNIIFTTPVGKNTTINGLAVGLFATPEMDADSLRINGMNVEIEPLGIIAGMYSLFGTFAAPFQKEDTTRDGMSDIVNNKIFPEKDESFPTIIKGVSISIGGLSRLVQMKGFSVNGINSFASEVYGFEISGIMNLHYSFNGVMIAILRNKTAIGKGLQIALFNNCQSGKVFQIGLINKIGKRTLPFLNWRL
jgi:hypothetical protein